jgi:signal transduction histidine kinase
MFRSAALQRDKEWIRQAAETSMAVTAHNIAAQLAALPLILGRYAFREGECPQLTELNGEFAEIVEEVLSTIKRTKERLTRVIARPTSFDFVDCIRHTLNTALRPTEWAVECCEELFEVRADLQLLETILLELIQNSKEVCAASDDLRVSVAIEPFQKRGEEWVNLVYRDNGPGVPDEYKEKIFEDFFSRRPGRKPGTGLGLGFVRRAIEAHGGSVLEQGTCWEGVEFVMSIPRRLEEKEGTDVQTTDR